MDPIVLTYVSLFFLIILINLIPVFMPASWIVLAFFTITFHLDVPIVVVLGVTASTIGRTGLYLLSERFVARFLSTKQNANVTALGQFLNRRQNALLGLVLAFTLLPVPSNLLYIAAGLARFNLKLLTASFVVGRLINYSVLVGGSNLALGKASELLTRSLTSPAALGIQILGLVILYFILEVDWKKILSR